jgi:hypothetical protein
MVFYAVYLPIKPGFSHTQTASKCLPLSSSPDFQAKNTAKPAWSKVWGSIDVGVF